MIVSKETVDKLLTKGQSLEELVASPKFSGVLCDNELVRLYINGFPLTVINSFLMGFSPTLEDAYWKSQHVLIDPNKSMLLIPPKVRLTYRRALASSIAVENLKYSPITPKYIEYLIQLDEMFRLSKSWQTSPKLLYRGGTKAIDMNLSKLNSFSEDIKIAQSPWFDRGTLNLTNLPEGFPMLNAAATGFSLYSFEKEYILPPCDFETKSAAGLGSGRFQLELTLRPLNLAKVMLQRMKNPPADYPKAFLTQPEFGYAEAMRRLEEYVENDVEKGIIRINNLVVRERPDPVVGFEYEI